MNIFTNYVSVFIDFLVSFTEVYRDISGQKVPKLAQAKRLMAKDIKKRNSSYD